MTLFQPFAVKMLQKIASLISIYYSQQRLFNKLFWSLILARQEQKLLAQHVIFVALGKWASVSVEHSTFKSIVGE